MAIPVEMPKMSDTMEEGVLVSWLVEEGATIAPGDILAQVETDKATMDLESYDDGVLLKKVVGEGDAVPIGSLIAILGKAGEDISDVLSRYSGGAAGDGQSGPTPKPAEQSTPQAEELRVVPSTDDGRIKSSPLARKLAKDHGLDLASIRGSGPEGRIIKRDVVAAAGSGAAMPAPAPAAAPATAPATSPAVQTPAAAPASVPQRLPAAAFGADQPDEVVRISQMRKAISRRLSESKFTSPHFYLTVDVDMTAAMAARGEINALGEKLGRTKVSYNDLVTKACAVALQSHPAVNSSYDENKGVIEYHRQAHVAVAVAIEDGLITPVIRNADAKGLDRIAAETRNLAERARAKQLQPDEYEGSTFTTSNLGMFGIAEFTAIINPPNACILAIGTIRKMPIVKNDKLAIGNVMTLTLSCDHRVVDGATGARFLDTVKSHLEQPATMLL